MPQPREVVITGLGVVCPIGIGIDAFSASLENGASGVDWLPEMRGSDSPFRYAARIKDFDPKLYVQPRKTIKVMCHEIQAAFAAAGMAMEQAKLTKGTIEPERLGVLLGSEMLYGELDELRDAVLHCTVDGKFQMSEWGNHAFKDLYPLWMLKYLPNMAACHISIAHDARGPNNSIVEGGVSSLLAISEAAAVIQRGHADAMLAGGSGSIVSLGCLPFRGWDHLTKWPGEPAEASRPFDTQRSGIVPGELPATPAASSHRDSPAAREPARRSYSRSPPRFQPLTCGLAISATSTPMPIPPSNKTGLKRRPSIKPSAMSPSSPSRAILAIWPPAAARWNSSAACRLFIAAACPPRSTTISPIRAAP
jgi:3-oxoacyl-[acyl-carrier-protein] synthase II